VDLALLVTLDDGGERCRQPYEGIDTVHLAGLDERGDDDPRFVEKYSIITFGYGSITTRSFRARRPERIMGTFSRERTSRMSVYMVERNLKGVSMEDLGGAQRAAINKGGKMSASGTAIQYIRSIFAPEDGRCMCLFDAASDADVGRLNDDAGLSYTPGGPRA
jgi:hypothetical protein